MLHKIPSVFTGPWTSRGMDITGILLEIAYRLGSQFHADLFEDLKEGFTQLCIPILTKL